MRSARVERIRPLVLLVLVASFGLASAVLGAPQWKVYRNAARGYQLQFPASWRLNESRPDDFTIFNFPEEKSVRGVVLPSGGAMLVLVPNFGGKATLDEWIEGDTKWAEEKSKISKRTVALPQRSRTGPKSCIEVTWDWEVGPNTFSRETACYFSLDGDLFKAQVSYWKDDPKQTAYHNLLHRILGTISTLPKKANVIPKNELLPSREDTGGNAQRDQCGLRSRAKTSMGLFSGHGRRNLAEKHGEDPYLRNQSHSRTHTRTPRARSPRKGTKSQPAKWASRTML